MPLKEIIKKIDKYFTFDEEKILTKKQKIKKILTELKKKKAKVKIEIKKAKDKHELIQLQKKLEAVRKLIKKIKKLLN